MHRICHVIEGDPGPDSDTFFAAFDAATVSLEAIGFYFELESDESFPDGATHMVWVEDDERATLSIVMEPELELCYIVVTASQKKHFRLVEGAITQHVPCVPYDTLLDAVQQPRALMWDSQLLVKLGVAAGERPDSPTLELLRKGLAHRSPRTRYHAALATAHVRWPELIPDLERVLKGEPELHVQDMARRALDLCLARQEQLSARR